MIHHTKQRKDAYHYQINAHQPPSTLPRRFVLEFWCNNCPTITKTKLIKFLSQHITFKTHHYTKKRAKQMTKNQNSYFSEPCNRICSRRISSSCEQSIQIKSTACYKPGTKKEIKTTHQDLTSWLQETICLSFFFTTSPLFTTGILLSGTFSFFIFSENRKILFFLACSRTDSLLWVWEIYNKDPWRKIKSF